jgi:magnesium transporter
VTSLCEAGHVPRTAGQNVAVATLPNLPLRVPIRPYRRRGDRGSSLPWIPDVDRSSAIIDCAVYRDGHRVPGECTWQEAIAATRSPNSGFCWIGLHEPSANQLAGIAGELGLHPLAVEDAVNAHQRPKLERYEDSLFAVVKTVHYNDDGHQTVEVVETGEVMVFLGANFVVTVRHGEHGSLRWLRKNLENNPKQMAHGPSGILHAIMDHVVDDYIRVTDALQNDIDTIETSVFDGVTRKTETGRIYLLKREVVELRRCVAPLATPLRTLAEKRTPLVADSIADYFRDVEDHLQQVVEQVASFDELLNTLVAANLAQAGVQQNEDMRKISAWVAIISVPTAVAGFYGMNFKHMPELNWTYSYPVVILVILLACFCLHRSFKRNGWL